MNGILGGDAKCLIKEVLVFRKERR